jgi:hypothetical protein
VLDDATSAVDPRVEAAILSALRASAPGRPAGDAAVPRHQDGQPASEDAPAPATSILVVAYRRATIALADEVVYVEHGRVIARGTHATLLATVPGYVDLVTAYEKAEAEREREKAYEDGLSLPTPVTSTADGEVAASVRSELASPAVASEEVTA